LEVWHGLLASAEIKKNMGGEALDTARFKAATGCHAATVADISRIRREHEIFGEMLRLLADGFAGETTINQLRVGHFISLRSEYHFCETSNAEISKELNIPRSTVSRIVTDLIEAKVVIERPDPDDGRCRLLRISEDHPDKGKFEMKRSMLIESLFE